MAGGTGSAVMYETIEPSSEISVGKAGAAGVPAVNAVMAVG
jgi:hypothetical protein